MFQPVTRERLKLRMAIDGPAGSGKSYTALRLAFALAGATGRVAGIDTEHGSLRKYAGTQLPGERQWLWDGVEMAHFAPSAYANCIRAAAGYDVLVVDSLSHAWTGVGGALEQVDKKKGQPGGNFTAWRDVTPQHSDMIDAILTSPCHVICTMRTKMAYEVVKDDRGRMVPQKIGLAPVQREGMEYEFDIVCDIDQEHVLKVSKSRCSAVDGVIVSKPDASFMEPIKAWLNEGREAPSQNVASIPPLASRPAWACTEAQEYEIKDLAVRMGWPVEKLREALAMAGVQRVCELSFDTANDLLRVMRKKDMEHDVPF